MSLCRTCEYALYDGMCMAHGKFTLLDAPACDDYKMHLDVEVSKLKAENTKLRELCADMLHDAMENVCSKAYWCSEKSWQTCSDEECGNHLYVERVRDLGVEVDG